VLSSFRTPPVKEGVGELAQAKLPYLLELIYHAVSDAVVELGSVANIRDVFIGFQEHLYAHHDD
jgi:type I restriction enzyme R subunit